MKYTLSLCAGLALLGAPALAQEDVHIAYINKLDDAPWFVREVEGAREKATELGIEFTHQGVQSDANRAISAVEAAIGAGVDGIAIVVPDQQIGPAVMRMAAEADIPIIAVDDSIADSDGNVAHFVGFSGSAIGRDVGTQLVNYHRELNWGEQFGENVAILSVEVQSLSVCMDRTDNANAVLMEELGATEDDIIHVPYDPGTLERALQSVSQTIVAYPGVERWLIHSCNDDGVAGATRALEQAGYTRDDIAGVGIDGQRACEEFKKPEATGFRASMYVDSAIHGATAVQLLYDAITTGAEIPAATIIDGTLITREDDKGVPDCQ